MHTRIMVTHRHTHIHKYIMEAYQKVEEQVPDAHVLLEELLDLLGAVLRRGRVHHLHQRPLCGRGRGEW